MLGAHFEKTNILNTDKHNLKSIFYLFTVFVKLIQFNGSHQYLLLRTEIVFLL